MLLLERYWKRTAYDQRAKTRRTRGVKATYRSYRSEFVIGLSADSNVRSKCLVIAFWPSIPTFPSSIRYLSTESGSSVILRRLRVVLSIGVSAGLERFRADNVVEGHKSPSCSSWVAEDSGPLVMSNDVALRFGFDILRVCHCAHNSFG
jgi:hypothetical protein